MRCLQCHPTWTEELCLKSMFSPLLTLLSSPTKNVEKQEVQVNISVDDFNTSNKGKNGQIMSKNETTDEGEENIILTPSYILATPTQVGLSLQNLILLLQLTPSSLSFVGMALFRMNIMYVVMLLYTENHHHYKNQNLSQISESFTLKNNGKFEGKNEGKSMGKSAAKVENWVLNGIIKPLFSFSLLHDPTLLVQFLFDYAVQENDGVDVVVGKFVVLEDQNIEIHTNTTPGNNSTADNTSFEHRITSVIDLLSSLSVTSDNKNKAKNVTFNMLTSKLFVHVLTHFYSLQTTHLAKEALVGVSMMLSSMLEKLTMDCLLSSEEEVLTILITILQHSLDTPAQQQVEVEAGGKKKSALIVEINEHPDSSNDDSNNGDNDSDDNISLSLTTIALNILSTLLTQQQPLTLADHSSNSKSKLSELQSILTSLANCSHVTIEESQLATDCALIILHLRLGPSTPPAVSDSQSPDVNGEIDRIYKEFLVSSSPPTRAYGIKLLSNLILHTHHILPTNQLEVILSYIICIGLSDLDSFVNIQATLAVLSLLQCDKYHVIQSKIFATLIYHFSPTKDIFESVFGDYQINIFDLQLAKNETTAHQTAKNCRFHIQIAEVINQVLKRQSGRIMSFELNVNSTLLMGLVAICIRLTSNKHKDKKKEKMEKGKKIEKIHDVFTGRLLHPQDTPTIDESQVTDNIQQMDELYLRQSAISLLAEIIPLLGYKITHFILDIFDIVMNVCLLESSYTDSTSRVMRRSAVFLMLYLLEHFCTVFLDDHPHLIREVGHGLTLMESEEKDEVVKFQMEEIKGIVDELLRQRLLGGGLSNGLSLR